MVIVMKMKQLLCGAMAAAMLLTFAGCQNGGQKQSRPDWGASSAAPGSDVSTVAPAGDKPTLGTTDDKYDGFTYLVPETLTVEADRSSSKKAASVVVYVPDDEYRSVSKNRAYTDRMGLNFTVDIAPYFQYDEDDYTLKENLEYFLEMEWDPDYTGDYRDLTISDVVEDKAGNSARATATYCKYDTYVETYVAFDCTYYLRQLEDGTKVLAEAVIRSDEATGKLPGLLEELGSFYGCEFEWDADGAQARIDALPPYSPVEDASGSSSGSDPFEDDLDDETLKNADGTFTGAGMTFSLPEGWDIADDGTFAPDGDSQFAGCAIMVSRQYNGTSSDDLSVFKSNPELLENLLTAYLKSSMDDSVPEDLTFKACETAPFGVALKASFTQEDDGWVNFYFLFDEEGYLYMMMAADTESDKPAAAALDTLFASAKKA